MKKPKISIVIPVYNVEMFLPNCIESAINQTLKDIEIICVDDGSTDNCGVILDSYAASDPRVRVVHKINEGYGVAMNTGLDMATGEYFFVLESDDFCLLDTCEILYKTAIEYDADIVRSDYFFYKTTRDGKTNLVTKQVNNDYSYYYRLICPNREREVYMFVMHNWTGIYKIDFLRKKNIHYNTTPGAAYQDNGFFFQVFSQTERLVYVPRPCYCYRRDNPGSSIHSKEKVYTMAKEYAFIRKFLSEHPEFEKELLPVFYARMFRVYHETFLRIEASYRKEFLQFFYKQFIEARDMNLLDIGFCLKCSAREGELLQALLRSPKEYERMVFRKTPYDLARKGLSAIEKGGLRLFFSKSRKYLARK